MSTRLEYYSYQVLGSLYMVMAGYCIATHDADDIALLLVMGWLLLQLIPTPMNPTSTRKSNE